MSGVSRREAIWTQAYAAAFVGLVVEYAGNNGFTYVEAVKADRENITSTAVFLADQALQSYVDYHGDNLNEQQEPDSHT